MDSLSNEGGQRLQHESVSPDAWGGREMRVAPDNVGDALAGANSDEPHLWEHLWERVAPAKTTIVAGSVRIRSAFLSQTPERDEERAQLRVAEPRASSSRL